MHAIVFHPRNNFWVVVAFRVDFGGRLKHLARAEFDADIAFLTTLRDDVDLTPRHEDLVNVHGYSCEDSHSLLTNHLC
jgi:hypothetical protein